MSKSTKTASSHGSHTPPANKYGDNIKATQLSQSKAIKTKTPRDLHYQGGQIKSGEDAFIYYSACEARDRKARQKIKKLLCD